MDTEPVTTQTTDDAPVQVATPAASRVSTATAVREIVRRYRETFERLGR